jgi:FkbM family methyltransferase
MAQRVINALLNLLYPLKRLFISHSKYNLFLSVITSIMTKRRTSVIYENGNYFSFSGGKGVALDHFDPHALGQHNAHLDFFTQSYLPLEGDVVFDVGSGNGNELQGFSELVGTTGKVVAIEADPSSFARSKRLAELLGIKNIAFVNCAISAYPGILNLNVISNTGTGNYITLEGSNTSVAVPTLTLDLIMDGLKLNGADFLKVNIEGYEYQALLGLEANKTLVKNVVISCHDFLGEAFNTYDDCQKFLYESGFILNHSQKTLGKSWKDFYIFARRDS